jgi:YHS domain-containing protein
VHVLVEALFIAALTASAQGQTSVTLAWDPSPDGAIVGYRLYDGVASGTYTNVIDARNATSATVSNLVNGVTYFFAVTACDRNGQESDFSDEISYRVSSPTNSPPRPPSGLTFAANSGTISSLYSGTLAWYPSPDSAIAGYRLYEVVASGTYTNVIDVVDVGRATSATVSNLLNGVTYFFAVTAHDTFGQESAFSDEISYKVPWPTDSPPTLALTSPANGAVYMAPATINFAADVVPNGHTVKWVEFYSGVTLLGAAISAPYSLSWNNVGAGTYSLSARVVYDSGSTVASALVKVTIAPRKAGPVDSQPNSFYLLQQQ